MVNDIAIEVNQKDVFRARKGRKPSWDGVNANGTTDLHFAAELNLDVLIKFLLNRGSKAASITEALRRCTLRRSRMLLRRQRYY